MQRQRWHALDQCRAVRAGRSRRYDAPDNGHVRYMHWCTVLIHINNATGVLNYGLHWLCCARGFLRSRPNRPVFALPSGLESGHGFVLDTPRWTMSNIDRCTGSFRSSGAADDINLSQLVHIGTGSAQKRYNSRLLAAAFSFSARLMCRPNVASFNFLCCTPTISPSIKLYRM